MSDKKRRVVVTGMGAVTPIGLTVEDFWQSMMDGKSGSAPITRFDASRLKTKFACEIKNFDPINYIDRKAIKRMDPYAHYAFAASKMAVEESKIDTENLTEDERAKIGVVFGSGIGGIGTFYDQAIINHDQGPNRISPFFIPMLIPDIAAGALSIHYGFRGPNYCIVSACATANNNMIDSFMLIKQGIVDVMLTGGSDAAVNEMGIGGFNASRAISLRNDSPETASRPFDANRDGFVLGEGAGALILEELEHAENRGADIYAEVIGIGLSADAYHITAPHPEGLGAIKAMEMAVENAGIDRKSVV